MKRYRWHSFFLVLTLLINFITACDADLVDEDEGMATATSASATATPLTLVTPPATGTVAPQPPPTGSEDKWALWVGGPHLRGANIWQRVVVPDLDGLEFLGSSHVGPPYRQADFDRLAALGANYVNISGPGLFTEEPPYVLGEQVQANLDNLLDMIAQADMFAVITFRTGPGRSDFTFYRDGAGDWFDEDLLVEWVWEDREAQEAWVEMWRFTAERYRDAPVVAGYDLMVEPHPNTLIDPDGELEPLEVQAHAQGTLMDWNAFAAEMTAAIREVDPDTPIIVNSLNWASAAWFPALEPTGDPRTIYSLHAYDPDVYISQDEGETTYHYPDVVDDYGETITFDRAWLEENYRPVREFARQHNVPIYVGEFGVLRWVPDAAAFLDDQIDLFEQYGWNYAVYVWRGDELYFDGFNLEYGPDPENHTFAPDNPLLSVFVDRWAQNVGFPGAPAPSAHHIRQLAQ